MDRQHRVAAPVGQQRRQGGREGRAAGIDAEIDRIAGRPALGPTLGSFPATRTKATAATDLTSSIKTLAANRTGSLTLGLTEDNPGTTALLVNVSTRESPSKGAYIDVVVDPAS